jgi:hypothetical protein
VLPKPRIKQRVTALYGSGVSRCSK